MLLQTPVKIQDLTPYMPHRAPAVWLDEVTSFGPEGGECRVTLKADGEYMGPDGVRGSAPIEWIAQGFGYLWACVKLNRQGGEDSANTKRAFLVAIKDADMSKVSELKLGDTVSIRMDGFRQIGPIQILRGRIFRGEDLILEAGLKVFSEFDS